MRTLTRPRCPEQATPTETGLVLFGGAWLLIGLFIDGYAHTEIIDTDTEDFFTPWHAIFYSGFAFSAAVIGAMAARRLQPGQRLFSGAVTVLPRGYRAAAVGLGIFAVGAVGDGVWHTIFGIETSIDALLSPTHLILLTGLLLILSAPAAAEWVQTVSRTGWRQLGVAVGSVMLVTCLLAFFLNYAFGLTEVWPLAVHYEPSTETNRDFIALGLASTYLATAVLVGVAIVAHRRWLLPDGATVVLWVPPVALTAISFDGSWVGIPAAAFGAAAVDGVRRVLQKRGVGPPATIAALGTGVLVMWSMWTLFAAWVRDVVWQAELWTGLILMNSGLATGLALVALAPMPAVSRTSG